MQYLVKPALLALPLLLLSAFNATPAYAQDQACISAANSVAAGQITRLNDSTREELESLRSSRATVRARIQSSAVRDIFDEETERLENQLAASWASQLSDIYDAWEDNLDDCNLLLVEQSDSGSGGSGGGGNGGGNGNGGSTVTVSSSSSSVTTIVTIAEVCSDDTCEQDAG